MSRFYCLLVLVLYTGVPAIGQGFYSVHSPNGIDVWAVGRNGNVFRSFDGGVTWGTFPQGTAHLLGVFTYGNNVWMVGENGAYIYSTDAGDSWNIQTLPGGATFRGVFFVNSQLGWIAGEQGTVMKTVDGGVTWSVRKTGTSQSLFSLIFTDSLIGYVSGEGGTLLKTTNGGSTWLGIGEQDWKGDLVSVGARGSTVYVTGPNAFCFKSIDGGESWNKLDLMTDSQSDVLGVHVRSSDHAVFVGGGGYVRITTDGGRTFGWGQHGLHATLSSIFFYDDLRGWACTQRNNVVIRTTDGGITWGLPAGTTVNYQWVQRLFGGSSMGNTFVMNPWDKNKLYVALGRFIYMSADRGETWSQTATIASFSGATHSFYISPKDTNVYVAAFTGGGDHIRRSTNRGISWTTTIARAFSPFGMPLEMDGSHPDTMIFAPEDGFLYRSTDFGGTWSTLSQPLFTSPCDFVIVRDSAEIMWCGDSGPSRISRSTNGGLTWTLVFTGGSSEIPTLVNGRHQNQIGYATRWSGGGLFKSQDYGATWIQVANPTSTWGVDMAKDDPNVVMFGVFGGATSYLSTNAGSSFTTSSLSGSNYAIYCYDRATFFAQQSNGVWKYNITYVVPTSNAQAITLLSPNGGEVWQYHSTQNITWSSTNLSHVRIDYNTMPGGPWGTIVSSTTAADRSYSWVVPNTPSSQARIRVSNALSGAPVDSSDGFFSITVAGISVQPLQVNFGAIAIGSHNTDTVRITNAGSATLVVSSVTSGGSHVVPGRTSFTIPPSASDTLSITFSPTALQSYVDTLRIVSNAPDSISTLLLTGEGLAAGSITLQSPNGGEVLQYNAVHDITWSATGVGLVDLSYKAVPGGLWRTIAQNVSSSAGSFAWVIPDAPTTQARVRLVDRYNGAVADSSEETFSIIVPAISTSRKSINFGNVEILQTKKDTLTIENTGTAPLTISSAHVDSAGFTVSRSHMIIGAGLSDTMTVFFAPTEARSYSATLALQSDAPASPSAIHLTGAGTIINTVAGGSVPEAYALDQNYPNPFNPATQISYSLPKMEFVSLKLYNTLGQELETLVSRVQEAGRHTIQFDPANREPVFPSGIYFYRLHAGDFVATKKMLLLK